MMLSGSEGTAMSERKVSSVHTQTLPVHVVRHIQFYLWRRLVRARILPCHFRSREG